MKEYRGKMYYTTGEVIDNLKVGQKAHVANHQGYHSWLVKVPAEVGGTTGGFEWQYDENNYREWFSLDDEILELLWYIR